MVPMQKTQGKTAVTAVEELRERLAGLERTRDNTMKTAEEYLHTADPELRSILEDYLFFRIGPPSETNSDNVEDYTEFEYGEYWEYGEEWHDRFLQPVIDAWGEIPSDIILRFIEKTDRYGLFFCIQHNKYIWEKVVSSSVLQDAYIGKLAGYGEHHGLLWLLREGDIDLERCEKCVDLLRAHYDRLKECYLDYILRGSFVKFPDFFLKRLNDPEHTAFEDPDLLNDHRMFCYAGIAGIRILEGEEQAKVFGEGCKNIGDIIFGLMREDPDDPAVLILIRNLLNAAETLTDEEAGLAFDNPNVYQFGEMTRSMTRTLRSDPTKENLRLAGGFLEKLCWAPLNEADPGTEIGREFLNAREELLMLMTTLEKENQISGPGPGGGEDIFCPDVL